MRRIAAALALLLALTPAVRAQSLDPASSEALSAAMAGSDALTQEIYALAAQIFSELAVFSGGDAAKMSQTLEQARSDPAAFAATLSPQTRERLHQLSLKLQPR